MSTHRALKLCRLVRCVDRWELKRLRDLPKIAFLQSWTLLHQGFVNIPELSGGLSRVLSQLGSARSLFAASYGQVPKHILHPLAETA
jgi:hypothetical protein